MLKKKLWKMNKFKILIMALELITGGIGMYLLLTVNVQIAFGVFLFGASLNFGQLYKRL